MIFGVSGYHRILGDILTLFPGLKTNISFQGSMDVA